MHRALRRSCWLPNRSVRRRLVAKLISRRFRRLRWRGGRTGWTALCACATRDRVDRFSEEHSDMIESFRADSRTHPCRIVQHDPIAPHQHHRLEKEEQNEPRWSFTRTRRTRQFLLRILALRFDISFRAHRHHRRETHDCMFSRMNTSSYFDILLDENRERGLRDVDP